MVGAVFTFGEVSSKACDAEGRARRVSLHTASLVTHESHPPVTPRRSPVKGAQVLVLEEVGVCQVPAAAALLQGAPVACCDGGGGDDYGVAAAVIRWLGEIWGGLGGSESARRAVYLQTAGS